MALNILSKSLFCQHTLIFLNTYTLLLCNGSHFDDVITRTRRRTQMGELVEIVANTPKFNFI